MIFNRFALTEIRTVRQMAKKELARSAGISAAYVTQLEKADKDNPSITTLRAFGTALEVDNRAFYVDPSIDRLLDEAIAKINGDRPALDLAIEMLQKVRDAR